MSAPSEDTAAQGGPQRPKIRDVGNGEIEIRGYHATRDPEGWEPKRGLHIGTERAAQHRMINPELSTYSNERFDVDPHGLYEVRVRVPRESVYGLRKGLPDYEANELASAMRGEGVPEDYARRNPTGVADATAGRVKAVGYRNVYEDPGSRSWVINEPSSISSVNRIYDAGSRTLGLMALLGQAAQLIPGFSERMPRTTWLANGGPLGDVLNEVIAGNYRPGGIMDPYRDMRDMPGFDPATGTVLA